MFPDGAKPLALSSFIPAHLGLPRKTWPGLDGLRPWRREDKRRCSYQGHSRDASLKVVQPAETSYTPQGSLGFLPLGAPGLKTGSPALCSVAVTLEEGPHFPRPEGVGEQEGAPPKGPGTGRMEPCDFGYITCPLVSQVSHPRRGGARVSPFSLAPDSVRSTQSGGRNQGSLKCM